METVYSPDHPRCGLHVDRNVRPTGRDIAKRASFLVGVTACIVTFTSNAPGQELLDTTIGKDIIVQPFPKGAVFRKVDEANAWPGRSPGYDSDRCAEITLDEAPRLVDCGLHFTAKWRIHTRIGKKEAHISGGMDGPVQCAIVAGTPLSRSRIRITVDSAPIEVGVLRVFSGGMADALAQASLNIAIEEAVREKLNECLSELSTKVADLRPSALQTPAGQLLNHAILSPRDSGVRIQLFARPLQVATLHPRFEWCPPHTRGDTDFHGNGPKMTVSLALRKHAHGIDGVIKVKAEETKRDWTTAEGSHEVCFWSGEPLSLLWDEGWEWTGEVVTDGHNEHHMGGLGPVILWLRGDRRGKDAGVYTGVKTHWRFHVVTYAK